MNIYPHCRVIVFPSDETISCDICNELLDAYLDAELSNANVKYRYPEIWQHLQTCETCAAHHRWLRAVLRKRPPLPLAPYTHPNRSNLSFLPFHQPQAADASTALPWSVYLRSQLLGEPFLLRFTFSSGYIQRQMHLLTPMASGAPLPAAHISSPYLLLDHTIPLPGQEIIVRIFAHLHSKQPGLMRLQATLSAMPALSTKISAKLQWGRLLRTSCLNETGKADLGYVSLALTRLHPPAEENIFAITFEAIT